MILLTGGRAWLLPGGGRAWLLPGGACMVAPGGMHGCSQGGAYMVARGVCMVAWGACVVAGCPGGHAWLLPGGCAWLLPGGHAWLLPGACVVFPRGGMHRIRRDTVNERAVRILLECILVTCFFLHDNMYRIITPRKRSLGKVICLHLSVILFTKGSLYDVTSYLAAWSYVPSGGSLFLVQYSFQGSLCPVPFSFGGVSVPAPMLFPRGSLCLVSCSFPGV